MAARGARGGQTAAKSGRNSAQSVPVSARSDRKSGRFRNKKSKDENRECLAWKVLSADQVKEFTELETVEEVQGKMMSMMSLEDHLTDLKSATLLDYYTSAIWWGREQSYTHEQQSALFTVIHTLLDNIKEKHAGIVENLKEFKKMLAGVGVDAAEISGGLECFDIHQARDVFDYVHNSLFQHYRLFEFLFTRTQAEEIIGTDLEVETAPEANIPWPPPLEEGVGEGVYTDHIATPPPTPPPQELTAGGDGEVTVTAGEEVTDGATGLEPEQEAELMAKLSSDEIKTIISSVFNEMLGGLETDIADKLREKENNIITKINKIHKVAEK